MKKYRILPHTADIRLMAYGQNFLDLLCNATDGMNDIIAPNFFHNKAKDKFTEFINIKSIDKTSLLIDFLSEVLTLTQTKKILFNNIEIIKSKEKFLQAKITGVKIKGFEKDIKAVTYHEAQIRKNNQGFYETIIVFDV